MKIWEAPKDSHEIKDYKCDWTDGLSGAKIVSSAWSIESGDRGLRLWRPVDGLPGVPPAFCVPIVLPPALIAAVVTPSFRQFFLFRFHARTMGPFPDCYHRGTDGAG